MQMRKKFTFSNILQKVKSYFFWQYLSISVLFLLKFQKKYKMLPPIVQAEGGGQWPSCRYHQDSWEFIGSHSKGQSCWRWWRQLNQFQGSRIDREIKIFPEKILMKGNPWYLYCYKKIMRCISIVIKLLVREYTVIKLLSFFTVYRSRNYYLSDSLVSILNL